MITKLGNFVEVCAITRIVIIVFKNVSIIEMGLCDSYAIMYEIHIGRKILILFQTMAFCNTE